MKIVIIGAGYVGLTTGICFAWLSNNVTLLDIDEKKVAMLRMGEVSFYEPGLEELLQLVKPNIHFTSSYGDALSEAEIIFLAVDTPPLPDGSPDTSRVRSAIEGIRKHFDGESILIVNKSTVPIGTARWAESILFNSREKSAKDASGIAVASNPEFLREGTALYDIFYPDRIIIGAEQPRTFDLLSNLYSPILRQSFEPPPVFSPPPDIVRVPLIKTSTVSAELIKYASNAFLATKISYINEIAQLAEKVGGDIEKIAEGIGYDRRIGKEFLRPGIGWGGSCLGKDTAALISMAAEYGVAMPIVEGARAVNNRQRTAVLERLQRELRILRGREIGFLGLAFKPGTNDIRDAPAMEIARLLIQRGAKIRAHDPLALPRVQTELSIIEMEFCDDVRLVFRGADAVLLMTEWPIYQNLSWEALLPEMRTPLLFDGRNVLDRHRLTRAGFHYVSLTS